MNNLIKYAAAQRALKLMAQPGGKGRRFFEDLMERQKGIDNFGPDSQMNLLKGLRQGQGYADDPHSINTLKQLLRQGQDYADDPQHVHSLLRRKFFRDSQKLPLRDSLDKLIRNRQRQLEGADDHSFVLRQQQAQGRANASEIDNLLSQLRQ